MSSWVSYGEFPAERNQGKLILAIPPKNRNDVKIKLQSLVNGGKLGNCSAIVSDTPHSKSGKYTATVIIESKSRQRVEKTLKDSVICRDFLLYYEDAKGTK